MVLAGRILKVLDKTSVKLGNVPRIYGLQNSRHLISELHASKSPYRHPRSPVPFHCEDEKTANSQRARMEAFGRG